MLFRNSVQITTVNTKTLYEPLCICHRCRLRIDAIVMYAIRAKTMVWQYAMHRCVDAVVYYDVA